MSLSKKEFEEQYLAAREKEGRLYGMDQVRRLPNVRRSDPYYEEWKLRRKSAARFVKYLCLESRCTRILEVGCGNGWFANYILQNYFLAHPPSAPLPSFQLLGQDINAFELKLAEEAFPDKRLKWTNENIFSITGEFDLIVFNASFHYFSEITALLAHLDEQLAAHGDIHILDSPFYETMEELKAARQRTEKYFSGLGYPRLASIYTPHLYSELEELGFGTFYRPKKRNLFQKLFRIRSSPFPWLVYQKGSARPAKN
jgi:trans-aconitate methyltransferase